MKKIKPCLWFDDRLDEAIGLYTSVFKSAKVLDVQRYGKGGPGREGAIMTAHFELEGQEFMALNGGPQFKFNEAISFFVRCESQEEVDDYWTKLTAEGGAEGRCGWLKDRFGLSWQIVPDALMKYLGGPDGEGRQRAMQAMLTMNKLVIADLARAYEG